MENIVAIPQGVTGNTYSALRTALTTNFDTIVTAFDTLVSDINADKLQGLVASQFLRSDADSTASNPITFASSIYCYTDSNINTGKIKFGRNSDQYISAYGGDTGNYIGFKCLDADIKNGILALVSDTSNVNYILHFDTPGITFGTNGTENTVWHTGNDGAESGLDADLLDGKEGSEYQLALTSQNTISLNSGITGDRVTTINLFSDDTNTDYSAQIVRNSGINGTLAINQAGTGIIDITGGENLKRDGNTIWHAGNDGSESGLDADLLDGHEASELAFLASPIFTGIPECPTADANTNNTQIASTAFVKNAVSNVSSSSGISVTSFKNKLINGNFDVWQRATSQTTSGYGSDDRWSNDHTGTGANKLHQQVAFDLGQTDVPGNPKYYSRTIIYAGQDKNKCYVLKRQAIEDVRTFAGQTVTLSFYFYSDADRNIAIEFYQYLNSDVFVTGIGSQLVAVTTGWHKYAITVDIPSIAGKTLGNTNFLAINFWYSGGSAWADRCANLGVQTGEFNLARVQVEASSIATDFEYRPYSIEELLCKRYYNYVSISGVAYTTTGLASACLFQVTMRISPSASIYSTFKDVSTVNKLRNASNGSIVTLNIPHPYNITTIGFPGITSTTTAWATIGMGYDGFVALDAEI